MLGCILSAWVGPVCPSEILCAVSLVSALTGSSYRAPCAGTCELKCKHCSGGKVGDIKTTESGVRLYPRMLPDCGILYKLGPYVVSGRVTVNAKPAASSISGTSSHNSDSQVFARLFAQLFARLFAQAVCPAVCPATVVNLVFQGSTRQKNTYKFESDKVLLYRKRLQGGPHVSLYCCILRLCPTGTTGVHKSINSTTSGPLGAPVLYGAPRVPQAMQASRDILL